MVVAMHRDIDISLLRAFLSVVETGSVTKAASALNLTQAAVSQQIKRLEELLESALFVRANRRLSPTAAGERLVAHARRLISLNDELWTLMRAPEFEGEVRLGVPHDIVATYLPAVLRRFDRAWPRVSVTLVSGGSVELLDKLDRGEVDLTLTTERTCPPGAELLLPDQLVWVAAERGSAAARRPLPVSLGSERCTFRPFAVEALKKASIDWRPVCQVSEMGPLLATIEADLAVAPMMRSVVPAHLRVLSDAEGLPRLPAFSINLHMREAVSNPVAAELAREIRAEMMSRAGEMANA